MLQHRTSLNGKRFMHFMSKLRLKIGKFVLEHSNSHGDNIFGLEGTTALNIIEEFIRFGLPTKRGFIWKRKKEGMYE